MCERDNPWGTSSTRPWLSTDLSTNVEISQYRPALSGRSFLHKNSVLLVLCLYCRRAGEYWSSNTNQPNGLQFIFLLFVKCNNKM